MAQEEELVLTLLKELFNGLSSPLKLAFGSLFEYVKGEVIFHQNLTHQEKTQEKIRAEEARRNVGEKNIYELRQEGKQPFGLEIPSELRDKTHKLLEELGVRYSFTELENGNLKIEVDTVNSEAFMLGYTKIERDFKPDFDFTKKTILNSESFGDFLKKQEMTFKTDKESVISHILEFSASYKKDKIFLFDDNSNSLGDSYLELTGTGDFLKMVVNGKEVHLNSNVYYQELVSRLNKVDSLELNPNQLGTTNIILERFEKVKELIDKEPLLNNLNSINNKEITSFKSIEEFSSRLIHGGFYTEFKKNVGDNFTLSGVNIYQAYEAGKNLLAQRENILKTSNYSFTVRRNLRKEINSIKKGIELFEKLPEFETHVKPIAEIISKDNSLFSNEETKDLNHILNELNVNVNEAKVEYEKLNSDKVKLMTDKELLDAVIDSEKFTNKHNYIFAIGDLEIIEKLESFTEQKIKDEISTTNDLVANAKTTEDIYKVPKYSLGKALEQIEYEHYQDMGAVALVSDTNNRNMVIFSDLDKDVNRVTFVKNGEIDDSLTMTIPDEYNLADLLSADKNAEKFIEQFRTLGIGFTTGKDNVPKLSDGEKNGCYIIAGEVLINDHKNRTIEKESIMHKINKIQMKERVESITDEKKALLANQFYEYINANKDILEDKTSNIYEISLALSNHAANSGKFETAFEDFAKSDNKNAMISVAVDANIKFDKTVAKQKTKAISDKTHR